MMNRMAWMILIGAATFAQAQGVSLGQSRFSAYVPYIEHSIELSNEAEAPSGLTSSELPAFVDAREPDFDGEWRLFFDLDVNPTRPIVQQLRWNSPRGVLFAPMADPKYHFHDFSVGHLDYVAFVDDTATEGMCLIFDDPIMPETEVMICRWVDYPAYAPIPVAKRQTIRLFHRVADLSS